MWRWVVVFADGYTYLNHPGERAVARSLDWPRGRGGRSVSRGPKRAVLGAAIAHAAGAEPTLLAVEPDLR